MKQGQHSPSFDVPERIDSILDAINAGELEPVMEPADVGLEPIHAVHDGGMIEFLAAAYALCRPLSEANRIEQLQF